MSKERLQQEVDQAVDAMKRAATKVGEQKTGLDTANSANTDLRKQLEDAKAAGGASAEELGAMASKLDEAQNGLDAALTATTGVQEALQDAPAPSNEQPAETPADPSAPTS